jgi:hypothetical protein
MTAVAMAAKDIDAIHAHGFFGQARMSTNQF